MAPSVRVSHVHIIAIDNRRIGVPNTRTVDGVYFFSPTHELMRRIVNGTQNRESGNRKSKLIDLMLIVNRAKRSCVLQSVQPLAAAPKAAPKRLPRHRGHHVAPEMQPDLSIIEVVVPAFGAAPKTTLRMIPNIDLRTSFFVELSEATVKYFVLAASSIENRGIENQVGEAEGAADEDEGDAEDGEGSGAGEEAGNSQDDSEPAA